MDFTTFKEGYVKWSKGTESKLSNLEAKFSDRITQLEDTKANKNDVTDMKHKVDKVVQSSSR
jgi:hypothetical protein